MFLNKGCMNAEVPERGNDDLWKFGYKAKHWSTFNNLMLLTVKRKLECLDSNIEERKQNGDKVKD